VSGEVRAFLRIPPGSAEARHRCAWCPPKLTDDFLVSVGEVTATDVPICHFGRQPALYETLKNRK
jgi:hypothetical protein